MLTLKDNARKEFTEYFKDKDITPIRIYLASGCGGARLGLALDEAVETDATVKDGEFTFVIDKELLDTTGAITIDADKGGAGFTVTPEHPLPAATGGCGGCCGGCGA